MKVYRFLPNQNRRVPVRWHDRGWELMLTLDSSSAGTGMGEGKVEGMEERTPLKARFPIATGRMISQPSRDARHRR